MDIAQEALKKHYEWNGKIEIISRVDIKTKQDLALAYTPGVAQPCLEIQKDPAKSYELTRRANLVAVITDGTAVLGLGDIGPEAAMPVMEGKCALFKAFAGIDAFPICVDSKDVDELVNTIMLISKSFGGINLEDIAAPRCFEVERRLKQCCDIPVFHDDQHGTAIIAAAAILNSLKLTGKKKGDIKIVVNGAGAAGIAISGLLVKMELGNVTMCDIGGIICEGDEGLNSMQAELSHLTNKEKAHGMLKDALVNADVFIGVSRPRLVDEAMVKSMNKDSVLFAMANPEPEIMPELALAAGARIIGTGRSDFPNQINNVLAFPGIFKGALAVRAKEITDDMKIAAAYAIAGMVSDDELCDTYILPEALNLKVADVVADAVKKVALEKGLARI